MKVIFIALNDPKEFEDAINAKLSEIKALKTEIIRDIKIDCSGNWLHALIMYENSRI